MKFTLTLLLSLAFACSCKQPNQESNDHPSDQLNKKETSIEAFITSNKTELFKTSTGKSIKVITHKKVGV